MSAPTVPAPSNPSARHHVVGEVIADVVRPVVGDITTHPGGSPANVAYGLARLGRAVTLRTELGDDPHGELIRRHLDSAGVTLAATRPSSGRTASATAVLGPDGSATYEFDLTWDLDDDSPAVGHHLHTGSIAAYLAPGADAVARLARAARATATVSLDPNIRPALLPDAADAHERLDALLCLADIVKASDEDLRWLYPDEDPEAAARAWLDHGPCVVVVTRGAAGSVAFTAAGSVVVPSASVTVVDTVGAGDSYMAALLDGLDARGLLGAERRGALAAVGLDVLRATLERAARAAGITVSRAGANPPTAAELDGARARA